MSDNFIPLNQSTPVGQASGWQRNNQRNQHYHHNNRFQNGQRRGGYNNKWGNSSRRNSSFGSDNSQNSSYGYDKNNIDAYLHPSMLQDPWEQLRAKLNNPNKQL